ncbi:MAG: hypothetical protein ACI4SG_00625 [Oligosphaeraceae bacterium]
MTPRPLPVFLPLLLTVVLAASALHATEERRWGFQPGQWSPRDWVMVRSPRFPFPGEWVQEEDFIRNRVPPQQEGEPDRAYGERLQGPEAPRTYVSMVLAEPVKGRKITLKATMAFQYRMAPLLVLANGLGADGEGNPEYREHWEIVLYDQGINVWHHELREGKPYWRLAAFLQTPFSPQTPHLLSAQVEFTAKGPRLTIRCGESVFGCLLPTLQPNFRAGLTACEGVNQFWDFTLATEE